MPEMPHALVAARLPARIANLHADSAPPTNHQAAQKSSPLPWSAGRLPMRSVLLQPLLIPLVPLPADVGRHTIGHPGLPLFDGDPLSGLAQAVSGPVFRVDLAAAVGIRTGV